MSKLITLEVEAILVPVVATLSECSVDPEYRTAICEGGIIQYLSKFLESENQVHFEYGPRREIGRHGIKMDLGVYFYVQ